MPSRTGYGAAKQVVVEEKGAEWEVTPGGMVVQKRDPESGPPAAVVPTIRVKVKHGSVYHEIYISSQATFGNDETRDTDDDRSVPCCLFLLLRPYKLMMMAWQGS